MTRKFSWILAILNFCQFNIVEGEVGEVETNEVETDVEATATDEVAITPQEAVLEEMGLADPDEPVKGEAPATEAKPDEAAATLEGATAEQKPKEITEADLSPLNSRNPATNERFQKITEGYKQEKARADELEAKAKSYESSFESLRQLGFADEAAATDLVNFSQYRQALYNGDAQTLEKIIGDQIRQFEAVHGRRLNINTSLLDVHEDLKGRVNSLDLDEETAFELARARTLESRAMRENQIRAQNQQAALQTQQMLDQSIQTVESLQQNWAKSDPDFQAILPILQPQMEEIGKSFPPSMWPKMVDIQYKTIKKALVENRQLQQREQPLRGNGFGTAKPVASSPQQAVLQAMGLAE